MIWIIVSFLVLLVAFIILQYQISQNKIKRTLEIVNKTNLDEIPNFSQECIRIFRDELNIALDINDIQASSNHLQNVLSPSKTSFHKIFTAFKAGSKNYYPFIIYIGAFLGELIRHHSNAEWKRDESGFWSLRIGNKESSMVVYPFDKIIKCIFQRGHTEGLRRYIMIVVGALPLDEATKLAGYHELDLAKRLEINE